MADSTKSICNQHSDLIESMTTLISDLKWLVRIGKWLAAGTGTILIALIPFVIAFMVHISSINSRMAGIDSQIIAVSKAQTDLSQALIKHSEMQSHGGSGQMLATLTAKVDAICAQLNELKAKHGK